VPVVSDCAHAWKPGPLPRPWWLETPPTGCDNNQQHDTPAVYDSCTVVSFNPQQCGLPNSGAVICQANAFTGTGRLTLTCRKVSDCPEGTTCFSESGPGDIPDSEPGYGTCEKTCQGKDPAACVRCDLTCGSQGVCEVTQPQAPSDGQPCVADCQCGPGVSCAGGKCNSMILSQRTGICGSGGNCRCTSSGVTCVDTCCTRADGSIVNGWEPECQ
jgi:hypothetical protein